MKKKVLLILGIVLVLAATATSLAYFTSKETKKNEFTVGSVQTKIIEKDFKQNSELSSNKQVVPKSVNVANAGENPVLVRVIINPQWDEEKDKDGKVIKPITSASNQVKLNFSSNIDGNWIKGNDGYYYYNKVLEPGETTGTLLESVQLKDNLSDDEKNEYKDRNLTVNVSSEAIQAVKKYIDKNKDTGKDEIVEKVNEEAINGEWNQNNTMGSTFDELIKSINDNFKNIKEK